MKFFVAKDSIVRQIWGKGDTVLFVFAGASAEFALNKAVDWLYFTGRLPADPLGRLFSTVAYAQLIVFSTEDKAHQAIDRMASIHASVEEARGMSIPDWAYRDVLYMLIDYSIRSFELLERKMTDSEKAEVFFVFCRLGNRMGLKDLPATYTDWVVARAGHLRNNLAQSEYTADLYKQYRKHLGFVRYLLLLEAQKLVVPQVVNDLMEFSQIPYLTPVIGVYKLSRIIHLDWLLKSIVLPAAYKSEIKALDNGPKR
ncbi:oxygenase MpaB family protein [Pontibacter sp. MBLB2868]|uniref:oxygenase MpaB family protein n=1 Tax=Pontibacter sp. MBLB2868 TaxID=3451555 RepID=UPI003F754C10